MTWRAVRRSPTTVTDGRLNPVVEDLPAPRVEKSQRRRWSLALTSLFIAAIALVVIGFAIWPGFGFLDKGRTPGGGVLLLHDLLPFDEGGDDVLGTRAEVDVQLWSTGSPGVSIAEVGIRFESPRSDDRWYLVASGDWVVTADRELSLYCKYGEGRVVGDRIRCDTQAGNPEMNFRFDQELGNLTTTDVVANSVVELDGYDRERVSVVSGWMPSANEMGESVAEVWLPIATPPIMSTGGEDFFAYPPVGWRDVVSAWGTGPPLAEPCDVENSDLRAFFALTESCAPVTVVSVTGATLDPGIEVGSRTVEYAAPDTVSDDELRWAVEGGFPGAQAVVRDPFAQADESRRAFIAALVLSGGVSFALLFVERLLFHRPKGDQRRSL